MAGEKYDNIPKILIEGEKPINTGKYDRNSDESVQKDTRKELKDTFSQEEKGESEK